MAGPIGTTFATSIWIHLGNGHRLKTIRPTIRRGDILGGFMGSKFWEMWSNGWAHWVIVQLQNADESGKGHRLNKLAPKTRRGAF